MTKKTFKSSYTKLYMVNANVYDKILNSLDDSEKAEVKEMNHEPYLKEENQSTTVTLNENSLGHSNNDKLSENQSTDLTAKLLEKLQRIEEKIESSKSAKRSKKSSKPSKKLTKSDKKKNDSKYLENLSQAPQKENIAKAAKRKYPLFDNFQNEKAYKTKKLTEPRGEKRKNCFIENDEIPKKIKQNDEIMSKGTKRKSCIDISPNNSKSRKIDVEQSKGKKRALLVDEEAPRKKVKTEDFVPIGFKRKNQSDLGNL